MTKRIAIVGFGFSGLMVVSNLVRRLPQGAVLYIVADHLTPLGVAYRTTDPQHLLNVPAGKMGAFAEAVDGFFQWLQTPQAALAKQRLGIQRTYAATDFVPRALYGAYLQDLWHQTQALAGERGLSIKLVETTATAMTPGVPLTLLTARGDAIAVDEIVLATGHETKPIFPPLSTPLVIQDPWVPGIWATSASWASPVALMGVGLTAVDTILSLRKAGYKGEIIAFSRNGIMPQVHEAATSLFAFTKETLAMHASLSSLMKWLRQTVKTQGEWRPVIDALRPYTPWLWQKLSAPDRVRFLKRLSTLWSTHRHRMAPEIGAAMAQEIASGGVRLFASKRSEAKMGEGQLQLVLQTAQGEQRFTPSHIVNCTGPEMTIARSTQPLLKQAYANGIVEPHATTSGIAADPQQRAWGTAYPYLFAIGTLLTGQLLESTAVPELRAQAALIAETIAP